MRRTTIVFDPEKVAAVGRLLGTKGLKATVDGSFDELLAQRARRDLFDHIAEGGFDFSPEVLEQAWGR